MTLGEIDLKYNFSCAANISILLLLLATATSDVRAADSTKPSLEVQPGTIRLYPDRETPVAIVVRNPTSKPIQSIRLLCLSDVKINLDCNSLVLNTLAPLSDNSWSKQLMFQPGEYYGPGTLTVIAEYLQLSGTKHVMHASAEIQNGAPNTVDDLAEVKIESSLATLTGQHPGKVFVLITNKTTQPINAIVTPTWPEFIKASDEKTQYTVDLAPHEMKSLPIGVEATWRVRPSNSLMLFDIKIEWGPDGRKQARHKVFTKAVDVGVFGESQILTLVGVPSFLILPGFLILTTVRMLWSRGWFKVPGQPATFPWEIKSGEFVLLAISISFIVMALYGLFWHNVLNGYNLTDIIVVWFVSVLGFGVIGFALITMWYKRRLKRITPTQNENDPLAFIEKIARRGLTTYLPRAEFKTKVNNAEVTQQALLIDPPDAESERIWVTPFIRVTWLDDALEDLKLRVRKQLESDGERDLRKLARYLREGRETDGGRRGVQLELAWQAIGPLGRPTQMNRAELSRHLGEITFINDDSP